MRPCSVKLKVWLAIAAFLFSLAGSSQKPVTEFFPDSYSDADYILLKQRRGMNKEIPEVYEKQILLALSYFPELINTHIIFRIKPAHSPLSARPSWLSVIRRKESRVYLITISDSSEKAIMPLLYRNMPFNAQVGVIGHELSHVSDFIRKNSLGLLRIGLGNMSNHFLDRFEYRTDSICIAHGLGYQLLTWSKFVRTTLQYKIWRGADNINKGPMLIERYMNPETIMERMKKIPMYL